MHVLQLWKKNTIHIRTTTITQRKPQNILLVDLQSCNKIAGTFCQNPEALRKITFLEAMVCAAHVPYENSTCILLITVQLDMMVKATDSQRCSTGAPHAALKGDTGLRDFTLLSRPFSTTCFCSDY